MLCKYIATALYCMFHFVSENFDTSMLHRHVLYRNKKLTIRPLLNTGRSYTD